MLKCSLSRSGKKRWDLGRWFSTDCVGFKGLSAGPAAVFLFLSSVSGGRRPLCAGWVRGMLLHNRSPRPAFSRAPGRAWDGDGAPAGAAGPQPPRRAEQCEQPREEGAKGGGGGEGQWV